MRTDNSFGAVKEPELGMKGLATRTHLDVDSMAAEPGSGLAIDTAKMGSLGIVMQNGIDSNAGIGGGAKGAVNILSRLRTLPVVPSPLVATDKDFRTGGLNAGDTMGEVRRLRKDG